PSARGCHPTGIGAVYDGAQSWENVRFAMLSQFNHNPATPHLVRDSTGRSGASKRVQDPIPRYGHELQETTNQVLGLLSATKVDAAFIGQVRLRDIRMSPEVRQLSGAHDLSINEP